VELGPRSEWAALLVVQFQQAVNLTRHLFSVRWDISCSGTNVINMSMYDVTIAQLNLVELWAT